MNRTPNPNPNYKPPIGLARNDFNIGIWQDVNTQPIKDGYYLVYAPGYHGKNHIFGNYAYSNYRSNCIKHWGIENNTNEKFIKYWIPFPKAPEESLTGMPPKIGDLVRVKDVKEVPWLKELCVPIEQYSNRTVVITNIIHTGHGDIYFVNDTIWRWPISAFAID